MPERKLEIKYRSVGDLIPYVNNAKKHGEKQVELLTASITEFDFTNPVLIHKDTIVAGHGRVMAAKKMGIDKVPTISLDHLSEAQRKAYTLADNRLGEVDAEWDLDLVSVELEELQGLDFNIDLTGFDDSFILTEPEDGLTDDDAVPDVPDEPVTVLGDIWVMGEHRLMCADSMEVTAMDALMQGHVANMVFTDPPYGVSYQSNMRQKSEKFEVIDNDDVILDIAPSLELYSTGWMFVWTTWKVVRQWIDQTAAFGYPSNMVVWSKGGGGIGDLKKTFSTDYEIALVFNRGADLCGKRIGSVWSIGKDKAIDYKHPTQKPVALAEEAIDKTTKKGSSVLDIFGGSGSTLIACQKSGRKCYMAELSEVYCDVIITRWESYTGKQATLESTGKTFEEMSAERVLPDNKKVAS